MSELELYKFVKEWNPEYRWDKNPSTNAEDVIMWVSIPVLEWFYKILPTTLFDEGGIDVRLVSNSAAFWMSVICDHCGIDMRNVFD